MIHCGGHSELTELRKQKFSLYRRESNNAFTLNTPQPSTPQVIDFTTDLALRMSNEFVQPISCNQYTKLKATACRRFFSVL